MANPRRSPTVVASIAVMQSERFPRVGETYRVPLDRPVLFRAALGDATTDDGWTAIAGSGGGNGRWLDCPEDDQGDDLEDGNATITVGGKRWRVLPAATLTGSATLTLGTTGARRGHVIEVTRRDITANTYAIANGGVGAGTLYTMAISTKSYFKGWFDGTNWTLRDAHAIP